jgi:hypothetical protein
LKTILSVFAAVLVSVSANAAGVSSGKYASVSNQEKTGQVGVGLAGGSLTGLSTQFWMDNDRAINATFAAEHGNSAISVAHLWLFRGVFAVAGREANYFVPYIGVGAIAAFGTQSDYFMRNNENVVAAAQVPLGIEFLPSLQRFDVFAELVPSLEITPTTVGFLTADLGARFYF